MLTRKLSKAAKAAASANTFEAIAAELLDKKRREANNDSVRRAYARADFWEERVRMMAWWADKCDEMRRGGVVVPIRA